MDDADVAVAAATDASADDVRLPLMSTQDATQKSLTMLKSEIRYWRTAMTTMISDSSSVEGADHVGAGSDGSADSHACGKAIPHGDAAAGDAACDGSADGLGCDQTGNATNFHNAVAKAVSASVQLVGQGRAWQFGDPVPSTPASEWALSRGWGPPTPLLQHPPPTPRDDMQTLGDAFRQDMARPGPYFKPRKRHPYYKGGAAPAA